MYFREKTQVKKPPLKLENLWIRQGYKELNGTIKFKGTKSTIELVITNEMCQKLLSLFADQLVESAREVAEDLKAEFLTIEAKTNDN